jgi:hypothetical protein
MTAVKAGSGRKQRAVGSQDVETQKPQLFDNRNQGMKDLLIETSRRCGCESWRMSLHRGCKRCECRRGAVFFAAQGIAQMNKIFDGTDSIQVAKQIERKRETGS